MDKRGAVTFIAALGLVMFAITQGGQAGWTSPLVLFPLLGGLSLLVFFVAIERRAAHPMLDLALLRNRRFMGWIVGATSVAIGSSGVMIFFPTYLKGANSLSAGDAGLIMLMMTAPVFVVPQIGARLVNRGVPARHLVGTALMLSAVGNALLVLLLHPGAGAATLAAPLILIGVANGLSMGLVDAQAMSMVEQEHVGMASGLLNTIRAGSNSLMLAVFGAALITLVQSRVGDATLAADVAAGKLAGPHHAELAGQFTYAWQFALTLVAIVMTAAAVLVHRMLMPPCAVDSTLTPQTDLKTLDLPLTTAPRGTGDEVPAER
ncbi:MFS transporter [Streptomyces sp. ISL-100]|uniref:MFS transporter n=1 Tax=Streptomyces sp. ISL-100 TaxID=2819173 RepID=UPI001BE7313E|nr:MFS transporter [Streptomyces sp. ISL-100]MBT2401751.1 MFS transporter [Streptomyces sp. ISL-100]